MFINYIAIKDPLFKDIKSFADYIRIESLDPIGHLTSINEVIMRDKPENARDIIFYSMPDKIGMRFFRIKECVETGRLFIISDFRYEWVV